MGRKVLRIDPDVNQAAMKYLNDQLDIMRENRSLTELSFEQYSDMLYKVAEPVQVIKNWCTKGKREWLRRRKIDRTLQTK